MDQRNALTRLAMAVGAALALAGCTSSGDVDAVKSKVENWVVAPADAVQVDCGSLLDDWSAGAVEKPVTCYTMEVFDDLPERFADTTASLEAHMADMSVVRSPACMPPRDNGVTVSCGAVYGIDGAHVSVGSGITLSALTADSLEQTSQSALNELTVWVTPEDQSAALDDPAYDVYSVPVG